LRGGTASSREKGEEINHIGKDQAMCLRGFDGRATHHRGGSQPVEKEKVQVVVLLYTKRNFILDYSDFHVQKRGGTEKNLIRTKSQGEELRESMKGALGGRSAHFTSKQ